MLTLAAILRAARRTRSAVALLLAVPASLAAASPVTVVEFYNQALDHYFISSLQPDIDALDSGRFAGWARTGLNFTAYSTAADAAGATPVCRFYIPPAHGDSHFFSASATECADVAARIGTDPNYSGYVLETPAAFYAQLPDLQTGACPAGTQPVYRLWNQRADSNHRYTTDLAIRAQMIARGYVSEGYGPLGVALCTPAATQGDAVVRVSAASAYPAGCDGPGSGTAYVNAEVEPMIAMNPADTANLIGVWQQDRWSDGGARGLRTGHSSDGGRTWALSQAAFTRCSSGNPQDFARASDPWVSIGATGIAYQSAIAFNGGTFAPGSTNAVLASRSLDGGATWSAPATLISDGAGAFNDKESITADPGNGLYAYAVWDRLLPTGGGPTWFARTTDGGVTWEPARAIFTPGGIAQTINNQIVVTPAGTLVLLFTQLNPTSRFAVATMRVMRSTDKGSTWSAPIDVAIPNSIGTSDPATGLALRDAGTLGSIAAGRNGALAVTWQDARFSGGTIENIAFARSLDDGLTWSQPVRVNAVPTAQALLPAVAVRDDGTYGVLYYDLRNDTVAPETLPADVWLAQSSDGVTWTESHVAGPFDFKRAPLVEEGSDVGLFIGDYQGLTSRGSQFIPFFTQTTPAPTDLTDIYAGLVTGTPPLAGRRAALAARGTMAPIAGFGTSPAAQRSVRRLIERRWVGPQARPAASPPR